MKDGELKVYGPDEEIAFVVKYKPQISRYIFINLHYLSRPHFTKEISSFIEYIITNPNKDITSDEIRDVVKIELKKGMDDVLRDIGFRGDLAKIFFRKMTNSVVHFVNPVYKKDLREMGIDQFNIYKLLLTPKRKSAIFPTN